MVLTRFLHFRRCGVLERIDLLSPLALHAAPAHRDSGGEESGGGGCGGQKTCPETEVRDPEPLDSSKKREGSHFLEDFYDIGLIEGATVAELSGLTCSTGVVAALGADPAGGGGRGGGSEGSDAGVAGRASSPKAPYIGDPD